MSVLNEFTTSSEAIAIWEKEKADRFPLLHPQLQSCTEVEADRRNFCDDYENYYLAMDVVRKALPQTYENIIANPDGCTLASRIINRLREGAMAEIAHGAVTPNQGSDGKRYGRHV